MLFPFNSEILSQLPASGDDDTKIRTVVYKTANVEALENGDIAIIVDRKYITYSNTMNPNTSNVEIPHCDERFIVCFDKTLHKKYDYMIQDKYTGGLMQGMDMSTNYTYEGTNTPAADYAAKINSTGSHIGDNLIVGHMSGDHSKEVYHYTLINNKGESKTIYSSDEDKSVGKDWIYKILGKASSSTILVEAKFSQKSKLGMIEIKLPSANASE